jgi:hypothetical protein
VVQVQHDPATHRQRLPLVLRRILRNRRLADDPGRINIHVTKAPFTLDQWYDQHPYGAASRFFTNTTGMYLCKMIQRISRCHRLASRRDGARLTRVYRSDNLPARRAGAIRETNNQ